MKKIRKAIIVNDTTVDLHHGCNAVVSSINQLLINNGFEVSLSWPAHANWKKSKSFQYALASADLIVVNGEGTIHHDSASGKLLLELGEEGKRRGIPSALINVGWEANSIGLIDKLKYFDVVSARDSYSAKMMESSGRDVRVVPDLSFWFAKNIASVPCGSAAGRRCVGFTDNVRINQSLHLTCLRRKVGGSPICINYGYEGFYGWLRFLRQGLSMRRDPFRPLFFLGVVIHRHQLWRERFGDTVDFINALSELQLLVSGRFHACTLAIASGTPVIAQASNTRKIESLFRDVGLEEWRLDFNLESCDILDNDDLYWSDEEMANIRFYIEQSVSKAESLFKDLSALVSKS